MSNKKHPDVERYVKEALKNCPRAYRKHLKSSLYSELYEYVDEHSETEYGEFVFCFGAPQQHTADYIA